MSASVEYGAFAFSTLGSEPHPEDRARTFVRVEGALRRATDRIVLRGVILPDPVLVTIDDMQDSITQRRAVLESLTASDGPTDKGLAFIENDGSTVSWQYGGNDPTGGKPNAVWYPTRGTGVRIVGLRFPKSTDVEHATLQSYEITFEADIDVECITGADGCFYRRTETWDNGVLVSVAYSGWVRSCDGEDCSDEIDDLIDTLQIEASLMLDVDLAPIESRTRTTDKEDTGICEFSVTFGIGGGGGTSSERLVVTSNLSIEHNRIDLAVTGRYTFTPSSRRSVINEAARLQGVTITDYLPSGAVPGIHTKTTISVDDAARTVTATQSVVGHWTHGSDILRWQETISISRAVASSVPVLHAWLPQDTTPPACSIHVGGLGPLRITISGTITSLGTFDDIPPRFAEDFFNGPIAGPSVTSEPQSLTPDVEGSLTNEGIYVTRYSQQWVHADPTTLPTPIPLASIISGAVGSIPVAEV